MITALLQAIRPRNWIVEGAVLGALVVIGMSTLSGWRSADAANEFPIPLLSLPWASPSFLDQTASELQHVQPQREILDVPVDYVTADEQSTGPFVVSVHPIDSTTWAAVAKGTNGRCYGALAHWLSPTDYLTYYAKFPMGAQCRGSVANLSSVTNSETPP